MIGNDFPSQQEIDRFVDEVLTLPERSGTKNPVRAKRKIEETLEIRKALGLPRGQQNERSALALLALLDLKPDSVWSESKAPLLGITPMMDFLGSTMARSTLPTRAKLCGARRCTNSSTPPL